MAIHFYFNEVNFRLNEKKRLKRFIEEVFNEFDRRLTSLNIIFCTDEYLLSINNDFLSHDYYTDIITFNVSDHAPSTIEGELYISYDRASDNAVKLGLPLKVEIYRLIFHGVLHLCGYTDKSRKNKQVMTVMENTLLDRYANFLH
jgi:probable rRNA maturation factor